MPEPGFRERPNAGWSLRPSHVAPVTGGTSESTNLRDSSHVGNLRRFCLGSRQVIQAFQVSAKGIGQIPPVSIYRALRVWSTWRKVPTQPAVKWVQETIFCKSCQRETTGIWRQTMIRLRVIFLASLSWMAFGPGTLQSNAIPTFSHSHLGALLRVRLLRHFNPIRNSPRPGRRADFIVIPPSLTLTTLDNCQWEAT